MKKYFSLLLTIIALGSMFKKSPVACDAPIILAAQKP